MPLKFSCVNICRILLQIQRLCGMIILAFKKRADVAQSVERILGKDEVTSSNLVISSRYQSEMTGFFIVYVGWLVRGGFASQSGPNVFALFSNPVFDKKRAASG